jgi:hypothetical protein
MCEDFFFRRNASRLLLREARAHRIELLIPEIAFEETANKLREKHEERRHEAARAIKRLRGLDAAGAVNPDALPSIDLIAAAHKVRLRKILSSAEAVFLPYPSLSHEPIARRAMDRRKPFDADGDGGYRDALFWETLVAAVDPAAPIVLVSGDKAAYGRRDGELDISLQDELEQRGMPRDAIRRIKHISDFTDSLPVVETAQLEVEHEIAMSESLRESIVASIEEEAFDYGLTRTSLIGLRLNIEELYIASIDKVHEIEVSSARELSETDLLLDLRVGVDMTYEVHIERGAAYAFRGEEDLNLTDDEDDPALAKGTVRRWVETHVEAVFDRTERSFTSIGVYNFIPLGDAAYWSRAPDRTAQSAR